MINQICRATPTRWKINQLRRAVIAPLVYATLRRTHMGFLDALRGSLGRLERIWWRSQRLRLVDTLLILRQWRELAESLGPSALGARRTAAFFHILFKLRFATKNVVIVLREAVGFVAKILEQFQPHMVAGETNRGGFGLDVEQLFFLGERNHHGRPD